MAEGVAGNRRGFWGELVAGVVALVALVQVIREDWQLVVVLLVVSGLILYYQWVYRFCRRRTPPPQPDKPFRNNQRYGLFLFPFPVILGILLFTLVPGTGNYVITAFVGTPTPTPLPTATITPIPSATTAPNTATATISPEAPPPPAACTCQKSTDDLTIRCLIEEEAKAANAGSLEMIGEIFSSDASVLRGDTNQIWVSAEDYYREAFNGNYYKSAKHSEITFQQSVGNTLLYVSGSSGSYQAKSGGDWVPYNNPKPSDHWALAKNAQGCWEITYYEFNAAHLDFPR